MPTLTLTYNTGSVPLSRIVDAFAVQYNYQATINGQPNPESKAEFARRMVGLHIKSIVREQEEQAAVRAAVGAVSDVTLT